MPQMSDSECTRRPNELNDLSLEVCDFSAHVQLIEPEVLIGRELEKEKNSLQPISNIENQARHYLSKARCL